MQIARRWMRSLPDVHYARRLDCLDRATRLEYHLRVGYSSGNALGFDPRRVNAVALPAALAAGWFLNMVGIGMIPLLFFHEMGHGMTAWLASRWAFPLPGFTFVGTDFSWLMAAGVFGGLFFAVRLAWREEHFGLLALSLFVGLLAAFLSFKVSQEEYEVWMTFGGRAGELVLSSLSIMAFYHRLPAWARWDFWRFPLLFAAACTFSYDVRYWESVADPEKDILFISADPSKHDQGSISESKEGDDDTIKLVRKFHWTPDVIDVAYKSMERAGAAGVAGHYLWFLFVPPPRRKEPEETAE